MGLMIHYKLHAPEISYKEAQELVAALRAFAVAKKFPKVSKLVLNKEGEQAPFPFEFPVMVDKKLIAMVPQCPAALFSFGFKGSDPGVFSLSTLDLETVKNAAAKKRLSRGYHWSAFCKTQFASIGPGGGRENFLAAHNAIVAMLEESQRLGIEVEVLDESEYWEHRDEGKLLAYVDHMNGLVAAVTGAFKDRKLRVDSPILETPEFERLEAQGQEALKHVKEVREIRNPEAGE